MAPRNPTSPHAPANTPSNPKQDKGHRAMTHRQERHNAPATRPNTITAGNDRADGVVKTSRPPKVGTPTITVCVYDGPPNAIANKGK